MNTFKYTSVCSRGVPGFCKTVLRFFINPHLSSLPWFDDFLNIADGITFDIVFILHDVKNLVRQPDGQQFLLVHAEYFCHDGDLATFCLPFTSFYLAVHRRVDFQCHTKMALEKSMLFPQLFYLLSKYNFLFFYELVSFFYELMPFSTNFSTNLNRFLSNLHLFSPNQKDAHLHERFYLAYSWFVFYSLLVWYIYAWRFVIILLVSLLFLQL